MYSHVIGQYSASIYISASAQGHLQHCVIGHDGTSAGESWYLEQVAIRESDSADNERYRERLRDFVKI